MINVLAWHNYVSVGVNIVYQRFPIPYMTLIAMSTYQPRGWNHRVQLVCIFIHISQTCEALKLGTKVLL